MLLSVLSQPKGAHFYSHVAPYRGQVKGPADRLLLEVSVPSFFVLVPHVHATCL